MQVVTRGCLLTNLVLEVFINLMTDQEQLSTHNVLKQQLQGNPRHSLGPPNAVSEWQIFFIFLGEITCH